MTSNIQGRGYGRHPRGASVGKARFKIFDKLLDPHGTGLQPWIVNWTLTWAAGPGGNEDGPLALREAPP